MGIKTKRFIDVPDGPDAELKFTPCEWFEPLQGTTDNRRVIAYLVYDSDADNPLEDQDGMGKIYSSHRHAGNEQHRAMQDAMGLDSDWNSNLQAIWDKHVAVALPRYTEKVMAERPLPDLVAEMAEHYTQEEEESDADFVGACLTKDAEGVSDFSNVPFWRDLDAVLTEMYGEPEFTPRNPDAVILDCYDHGGQVWSVSGGGMQCQWDTSRGAGVWVPDDCAREEIERRAPIYAHYWVENTDWIRGTGKKYLLHGPDKFSQFGDDWGKLFELAEMLAKDQLAPTTEQLRLGRHRAAQELAKEALDEYNAWLSGQCYGIVIQTHDKETSALIDSDECWNFIGTEYAQQSLKDEFDSTLKSLQGTQGE